MRIVCDINKKKKKIPADPSNAQNKKKKNALLEIRPILNAQIRVLCFVSEIYTLSRRLITMKITRNTVEPDEISVAADI